ncbi:hypothetical protein [Lewinella sp. IMCC34183]|uniref:hypothetical protein n=1 Tax=Lewinella sp. IMCC34183 TaxID=2248762 RepID=UPI000E270DE2|nr:hypothetical protein [Lewinella sp. IMCC34183]
MTFLTLTHPRFFSCCGWLILASALHGQTLPSIHFGGGDGDGSDSGISFFTTLPVEIVDFRACETPTGIIVAWESRDAVDIAAYFVEEALDGKHFQDRARRAAHAGKPAVSYSVHLSHPAAATATYRLRVEEADGSTWHSELDQVTFDTPEWSMEPRANPTAGKDLVVQITGLATGEQAVLEMTSLEGRKVHSAAVFGAPYVQEVRVPSELPAATYVIGIVREDGRRLSRQVVIR